MILTTALLASLAMLPQSKPAQTAPSILKPGMVISKAMKFKPGEYLLASKDLNTPAITISGSNLTLDFSGVKLAGSSRNIDPDKRGGLGLLVKGSNITIKNLTIRGYKVGLIARGVPGLKLIGCDFSYNWKQHLHSTLEREDTGDWMSYHKNENEEWLGYGASAYLKGCDGFEVKGCRSTGGQCGLMLVQSNKGVVWNNDFSFLSAVGIGLYRSSDNKIMHNRIDWCVRGYSHGVYNRGQDSTGVLIYEQSNRNVFAYNSGTHGGDGFFLWAGQSTMDTGEGGCNDNVLYGNDWSHSPANGIEATFSRNIFVNNLLLDSWHGVWGGFSYDNVVMGNWFGGNGESIAIEHGQRNEIAYNQFDKDWMSVYLWQNASVDPNWGYGKTRDIRNHGSKIHDNVIRGAFETALQLGTSDDIAIDHNLVQRSGMFMKLGGTLTAINVANNQIFGKLEAFPSGVTAANNTFTTGGEDAKPIDGTPMFRGGGPNLDVESKMSPEQYAGQFRTNWDPTKQERMVPPLVANFLNASEAGNALQAMKKYFVAPLAGGMNAFLQTGSLRGRRYILVDEWGPYDFRRPILWPRSSTSSAGTTKIRFEVLGPNGVWAAKSAAGATLSTQNGSVPGWVEATLEPGAQDVRINLEYTGAATTDVFGRSTPAGKAVGFGFSQFRVPQNWEIKFFKWDASNDPRTKVKEFAVLILGDPFKAMQSDKLDFAGQIKDVPGDHYATVAETPITLPGGEYDFELTTDDGARLYLDGKLLIEDAWKYQAPATYTRRVKVTQGTHRIRVEHFQIDGYAALKFNIRPVP